MTNFDPLLFVPTDVDFFGIEFALERLADGTYRATLAGDHSQYYYGDTPFEAIEIAVSEYDHLWRERQQRKKGTSDE